MLTSPIFFIFAIMMMNNSVFIYINSFYPLPDYFRIGNIIRLIFLPSSKRRVWTGSRSYWQSSTFLWCLRTCAPLLHSGLGDPPLGLHSSHAPKHVMQCCHRFTGRFPPPRPPLNCELTECGDQVLLISSEQFRICWFNIWIKADE